MMPDQKGDITELLIQEDWDRLLPLVYDKLTKIAHFRLVELRPGDTLDTHALVHTVFINLIDQARITWKDRGHFFAVASRAMRWTIINHAKKRNAKKRGGGAFQQTLEKVGPLPAEVIAAELVALDQALERLARLDERQSQVVECRFFGGLTIEETAEALSISPSTVKREWRKARAWLRGELQKKG